MHCPTTASDRISSRTASKAVQNRDVCEHRCQVSHTHSAAPHLQCRDQEEAGGKQGGRRGEGDGEGGRCEGGHEQSLAAPCIAMQPSVVAGVAASKSYKRNTSRHYLVHDNSVGRKHERQEGAHHDCIDAPKLLQDL